jgi:hypothetical protein
MRPVLDTSQTLQGVVSVSEPLLRAEGVLGKLTACFQIMYLRNVFLQFSSVRADRRAVHALFTIKV